MKIIVVVVLMIAVFVGWLSKHKENRWEKEWTY